MKFARLLYLFCVLVQMHLCQTHVLFKSTPLLTSVDRMLNMHFQMFWHFAFLAQPTSINK